MATAPVSQFRPKSNALNGPLDAHQAKTGRLPLEYQFDPAHMLAEGHFGKVYQCNAPAYVVKQILRTRLSDAEVEAMVFVQRASPRHHVGLVEYYCDSTHAFLIMEKAETDLIDLIGSRHVSRRWFTFQEVLSAGMAMLESIQALHDNNILHRDIKPVLSLPPCTCRLLARGAWHGMTVSGHPSLWEAILR